ncbi:hypothetical protein DERF_000780, partial [Dermatophagoides farinae]
MLLLNVIYMDNAAKYWHQQQQYIDLFDHRQIDCNFKEYSVVFFATISPSAIFENLFFR